jgi:hypothetical protein
LELRECERVNPTVGASADALLLACPVTEASLVPPAVLRRFGHESCPFSRQSRHRLTGSIIVKSIAVLVLVLTALLADVFSSPSTNRAPVAAAHASPERMLGKF